MKGAYLNRELVIVHLQAKVNLLFPYKVMNCFVKEGISGKTKRSRIQILSGNFYFALFPFKELII